MENKQTNLLAALREPLPAEAIKPHPTKSYLSQINSIYVIERLNDVFGLGGWQIRNEIIEKIPAGPRLFQEPKSKGGGIREEYAQAMVIVKSIFTARNPDSEDPRTDIYIEAFGGNDNDDLGDAYKGACTDALTKIGSYLGIGAHVWKDDKSKGSSSSAPRSGSAPSGDQAPSIIWVNQGTPEWRKIVLAMAKNINEQGGKFEDLVDQLRKHSQKGFSRKDLAQLRIDIDQEIQKGGAQ